MNADTPDPEERASDASEPRRCPCGTELQVIRQQLMYTPSQPAATRVIYSAAGVFCPKCRRNRW